jgi:hypothetical protein
MKNPLTIAPPPPRPVLVEPEADPKPIVSPIEPEVRPAPAPRKRTGPPTAAKFLQVKEDERVQFNKRVTRHVADGFEMLAIRTRRKVPELLAEALSLLEERYGRVG